MAWLYRTQPEPPPWRTARCAACARQFTLDDDYRGPRADARTWRCSECRRTNRPIVDPARKARTQEVVMRQPASSPAPAVHLRRLAKATDFEGDPRTLLRGLDDDEADLVAAAIVRDVQAHPWPVDGSGRLQDQTNAVWPRIRSVVINTRGERLEQAARRPHFTTHRLILDVVLCLAHATARRAELEAALADLDALPRDLFAVPEAV